MRPVEEDDAAPGHEGKNPEWEKRVVLLVVPMKSSAEFSVHHMAEAPVGGGVRCCELRLLRLRKATWKSLQRRLFRRLHCPECWETHQSKPRPEAQDDRSAVAFPRFCQKLSA